MQDFVGIFQNFDFNELKFHAQLSMISFRTSWPDLIKLMSRPSLNSFYWLCHSMLYIYSKEKWKEKLLTAAAKYIGIKGWHAIKKS